MSNEATSDRKRYLKIAAIPEFGKILEALTSWDTFRAYYTPQLDEQAAENDPQFIATVEKIWQAVYKSAIHTEKGLTTDQIVVDPARAIRASIQHKYASFLPTCKSYAELVLWAKGNMPSYYATHTGDLLAMSELDWRIPFEVPYRKNRAKNYLQASGQEPQGPQEPQAAEKPAGPSVIEQIMAIAATEAVKTILQATKEGQPFMEKYYPQEGPFLQEQAIQDSNFVALLKKLFDSINRSLGRDPSAKDIQSQGPSTMTTLAANIQRSTHFRLAKIVPVATTKEQFEQLVSESIPNRKDSLTKLTTLGGLTWNIRFDLYATEPPAATPQKTEGPEPPHKAEPEAAREAGQEGLFDTSAKDTKKQAYTEEKGETYQLRESIKQHIAKELDIVNQNMQQNKDELENMQRMLRIIIEKSNLQWSKPLTNDEIKLISKYIS